MIGARFGRIPTTSVRRRISFFSRSCGSFDPDLPPDLAWDVVDVFGRGRELRFDRGHDPGEPLPHGVRVGLVEDRTEQCRDTGLRRLRDLESRVAPVMRPAALPGRAQQRGADRGNETVVGIGDDELDAGQPAGGQGPQEGEPAGPSSSEQTSRPPRPPSALTPTATRAVRRGSAAGQAAGTSAAAFGITGRSGLTG